MKVKYLLKLAAKRYLPKRIINKRKIGFGVPVSSWMRNDGPLRKYLNLLSDQKHKIDGINPVRLEKLIREHQQNIKDHQDILWPLLNYVIWRNIFFGN